MRSCAFPFNKPGQKMLLTAPELNPLRPIADAIEQQLLSTRLLREMLPETEGNGSGRLAGPVGPPRAAPPCACHPRGSSPEAWCLTRRRDLPAG